MKTTKNISAEQSEFIKEGLEAGHEIEVLQAFMRLLGDYTPELQYFEESFQGIYDSDEEFAQEMVDQMGLVDNMAQWPQSCIDWEHAASELMHDYMEENGYYFRITCTTVKLKK